jgi:predicted dehydrogenase
MHASMALRALKRGKHVLVEKPLALEWAELGAIRDFFDHAADRGTPVLLTGFNRRFSPIGRRIKELIAQRTNPMILNYRLNAGHMPLDHWVHTTEGGGRNRGEACHIYDLFTFLTGGSAIAINAQALTPHTAYYGRTDNFVATIRFADGSVASLTYTALGSDQHPKEQLDIYVDGTVLVMEDYRRLQVAGAPARDYSIRTPDKGHRAELKSFARAVHGGGEWPIPLWEQIQATEVALRVEEQIRQIQ